MFCAFVGPPRSRAAVAAGAPCTVERGGYISWGLLVAIAYSSSSLASNYHLTRPPAKSRSVNITMKWRAFDARHITKCNHQNAIILPGKNPKSLRTSHTCVASLSRRFSEWRGLSQNAIEPKPLNRRMSAQSGKTARWIANPLRWVDGAWFVCHTKFFSVKSAPVNSVTMRHKKRILYQKTQTQRALPERRGKTRMS